MAESHKKANSAVRQWAHSRFADVQEDAGESWAFVIFLVFLLVLTGITLWLSFFRHSHLTPSELLPPLVTPADLAINEPILPVPFLPDLDQQKVALGQRLFFETKLSGDNTLSCNSCHDLSRGGADNKAYSTGVGGAVGKINALTVFNSANNIVWFWDGRATTPEDQLDGPVLSQEEMNADWAGIVLRLKQDKSYVADFGRIYEDGISESSIKNALVTFGRTLITPNSPFDRYLRGDHYAIDDEEKKGYQLFKNYGCSSCHQGANVGGNLFQALGVVGDFFKDRGNVSDTDFGRYNVTGREVDRYHFRVPSLRNVALTAPYFHDGSAVRLEDAVYIMAEYQLGRKIPAEDINLIVRFLHTLTGEYGYQK